jgi:hypothetical protein
MPKFLAKDSFRSKLLGCYFIGAAIIEEFTVNMKHANKGMYKN